MTSYNICVRSQEKQCNWDILASSLQANPVTIQHYRKGFSGRGRYTCHTGNTPSLYFTPIIMIIIITKHRPFTPMVFSKKLSETVFREEMDWAGTANSLNKTQNKVGPNSSSITNTNVMHSGSVIQQRKFHLTPRLTPNCTGRK